MSQKTHFQNFKGYVGRPIFWLFLVILSKYHFSPHFRPLFGLFGYTKASLDPPKALLIPFWFFVKLYLMDSYPKSKVGELEVALKTGFAAVVFVCFIEPSKPMRVVWIVHFLLVASVWGSVLAHCRKKWKKKFAKNSQETGIWGAGISAGAPGKW